MVRRIPRLILAARTQRERQQRRAGIRLRDFSITAKTRAGMKVPNSYHFLKVKLTFPTWMVSLQTGLNSNGHVESL